MNDLHLGSAEDEIRLFCIALQNIFHGEAWDVVEPHARRSWIAGAFADGTPWEAIAPRIRASWNPVDVR